MAVPKITERSPWGTYPNADPKKAPKPAGTATMEAADKMERRSIPPKTRGIDKKPPYIYDWVGAGICLSGISIIMWAPRN